MPRRALISIALVSMILSGCHASEENQIRSLLQKRNSALQQGDARTYLSCLGLDYNDPFFPFTSASYEIKEILASRERPQIRFSEPKIYPGEERAVVREEFWLEGVISGKARSFNRTQHLRLQKEEEPGSRDLVWKIVSGSEVYRLLSGQVDEEDRIEEILGTREKALENRDIQMYGSVVSPKYSHRGKSAEDLLEKVEDIFLVFDDIKYEAWDRKISFFGNYALVEQRYKLEARRMGEPQVDSDIELIELVQEDDGWKIVKGL